MKQIRTWLFVPGNNLQMIQKSRTSRSDALIFDLEDAVSSDNKIQARQNIIQVLKQPWSQTIYVRVTGFNTPTLLDEVIELCGEHLSGFVLPKVESANQLQCFSYLLDLIEKQRGLEIGRVSILPIIETAAGLKNVHEIASSVKRVSRLAFGSVDFSRDIGVKNLNSELHDYVRSTLVIASRVAGIQAPVDAVYLNFRDSESLRTVAKQASEMGFSGKFAIHPSQIDVINAIFSISESEILEAKEIVDAYENAVLRGQGVVQVNGQMVDFPIYDQAKRLLDE
ncbi:CoA ester lyase [Alicyclobacillus fastidiosus]|uniref:CoA ester lyase n=1 Tax=Alicyclobacillus fastidiosus TaxID=392011 RepID=A0ABY6ZPJ8_9BACL|nr:CoA ester lyase [Alicyclobacillus fastidiosus]WAH44076.1 CoA ester lyase [Alicyclobacillus fastidiosus]GMA60363.1 CoA ester lyase [Alicyclobacillus fastidiosus]